MRNPFRSKKKAEPAEERSARRRDTSWRDQVDPELRTRDPAGAVTTRAVGTVLYELDATTAEVLRVLQENRRQTKAAVDAEHVAEAAVRSAKAEQTEALRGVENQLVGRGHDRKHSAELVRRLAAEPSDGEMPDERYAFEVASAVGFPKALAQSVAGWEPVQQAVQRIREATDAAASAAQSARDARAALQGATQAVDALTGHIENEVVPRLIQRLKEECEDAGVSREVAVEARSRINALLRRRIDKIKAARVNA